MLGRHFACRGQAPRRLPPPLSHTVSVQGSWVRPGGHRAVFRLDNLGSRDYNVITEVEMP